MAPHFLKLMEERRLEISRGNKIEHGYSRLQPVAILLVKGEAKGKPYFLHKWDDIAKQFQLIGGKQRPKEPNIETAMREMVEEVSRDLRYGRDYELTLLNDKPIQIYEVSRSYGALTLYQFSLYRVQIKIKRLCLSESDKWISIEEMQKGFTKTGRLIRDAKVFRLFDSAIPNGLEKLPATIKLSNNDYLDYVEMKPGFWGFNIDIKRIIQNWLNRKRNRKNGT